MPESTLNIAMWLERRLDMSLGFHLPAARLYGIVVNDPLGLADDDAQAARPSFIDESRDVYELLAGSAGVIARSFDAAAIVTTGWAAPLADDGSMTHRASRHPDRRRVRAVAVVSDEGVASVIRFEDDPQHLIGQPERGSGDIVDAMEAMWFGRRCGSCWPLRDDVEPYEPVTGTTDSTSPFLQPRLAARGCLRRP